MTLIFSDRFIDMKFTWAVDADDSLRFDVATFVWRLGFACFLAADVEGWGCLGNVDDALTATFDVCTTSDLLEEVWIGKNYNHLLLRWSLKCRELTYRYCLSNILAGCC